MSHYWDDLWRQEASRRDDWKETDDHCNELEFIKKARGCVREPTAEAAEIGSGSAKLLLNYITEFGGIGFAIDTSLQALDFGQRNARDIGLDLKVVCADAGRLPFPDSSFSAVLSGGLLEHFPDPKPVVAEMCRVLKPGGIFYADIVPRKFSLWRIAELPRMLRSDFMAPGVYESAYGPSYYIRFLSELGMVNIQSRWEGVYWIYRLDKYLNQLKRVLRRFDGTRVAALLGWYFMISARKSDPGYSTGGGIAPPINKLQ